MGGTPDPRPITAEWSLVDVPCIAEQRTNAVREPDAGSLTGHDAVHRWTPGALPDAQRAATIKRLTLTPCTPRTITDKQDLARECDRIREQG